MRTRLALKSAAVLDEKNARHVSTALKWLDEGNVTEACKEIRLIQRLFASHPAVIELRQRLVAVVCGLEETNALPQAQAA